MIYIYLSPLSSIARPTVVKINAGSIAAAIEQLTDAEQARVIRIEKEEEA